MATDPDDTFASRLKMRREALGLSQAEIAQRLAAESGLSFQGSTIYKIETGKRKVTVAEAVALASALRTPLAEMLDAGVDSAKTAKDVLMDRGVSALLEVEEAEHRLARVARAQVQMQQVLANYRDLFGADPVWLQLNSQPSLREFWGSFIEWEGPREFAESWQQFMKTHGDRYSTFLDFANPLWGEEESK